MGKFNDVPSDKPYYDSIEYVTNLGCMEGHPSGNFEIGRYVIYAEALISISKFLGIEPDSGTDLSLPALKDFEYCKEYVYSCIKYKICSLEEISAEKLKEFIDWDTLAQLMNNAKTTWPLLALPKKKTEKKVSRIPRAILAHYLYLAGKNTASKLLDQVLSCADDFSGVIALTTQYYFSLQFLPSDILKILDLINDSPDSDKPTNYSCLWKIYKLKEPFKHPKSSSTQIYHYTSLYALEKLTQPGANFRLSNTAYLNDPEEGKLAQQIIPRILKKYETLKSWNLNENTSAHISTSNTFIASFMKKKDKLEMWAQYGAGGSGCCLGIPSSVFDGELYSVFYNKKAFSQFFQRLCIVLNDYVKSYPDINIETNPVFRYATDTVKQVAFLYKDRAYAYEKEVRILSFRDPKDAQTEDAPRPGEIFPRLYIEASIQHESDRLPFSLILLGPKVQDTEKIAVSLVHRGYDNKIIQKSEIKFR